jgi:xanthine/uracil/vitamin C permease (AzgA family)
VTLLRRLAFIFLLVVLMLLAAMFAYSNPQPIDVDIGLVRIEQISMALAFAVVFICGWLFGLLTAELSTLRGAPLQDAH